MSRTIPIWACVVNRACFRLQGLEQSAVISQEENERWNQMYVPPWVGDSERAQIEKRLEHFVITLLER